jgi:hypothetical protein
MEVTSTLYSVTITEYERGMGQRVDSNDTRVFTTYEEARKYADHWEEGGSPDCFWRARIEKIS